MKRRFLASLLVLGAVASGCSLGDRETWAEQMRDAWKRASALGSAHVQVGIDMKVIHYNGLEIPPPLFTGMDGVVDFKSRLNKLNAKGIATKKGSVLFFDDLVNLWPRSAGARADHDPSFHWARYDFKHKPKPDTIDGNDRMNSIGYAIAPSLAVELLKGVLAGSITRLGTSTMDGEQVTEYTCKLAPDALIRDLRVQGRIDGIQRMFKIIGATDDLFRVHVWMDASGIARRIQFVLKQHEDIVNAFKTTVDYRFTKFGASVPIALPVRSDSLGHKRFVDFIAEYIRSAE